MSESAKSRSLPFCAGVQFSRYFIHVFNNRIKLRENRSSTEAVIYLFPLIIQNENVIQPETHLAPVSPTSQTGFSPRRMVFAVLQQGEVEGVQLLYQVLSPKRQTIHFKTSTLYIDTILLNIVSQYTKSHV